MKWLIVISGLSLSSCLLAAPPGFEDLMTLTRANITFVVNDDAGVLLPGEIGAQSVRVDLRVQEKLKNFLIEQYLKPDVAQSLAISLTDGADTSILCKGRRDSCWIDESQVEKPQVVVMPNENKVRILVPSSLMAEQVQKARFIDESLANDAFIMHHNLNVGIGSNTNAYGFYNGNMLAGLGGGFFRGDINLASDKKNNSNGHYVYADEVTWNYLIKGWRTQLGYVSERNDESWNATSLFNTDEQLSSFRFSLGTTSELEYKSKATSERLYFSSPSSGRLKVTREDGTPVLERNVTAGQQYISYDELPRGITTLILKVESGGQEVYREERKVYNIGSSALSKGDFDVLFSAGFFQDKDIFPSWVQDNFSYDENLKNKEYLQAQLVGQLATSWQVGVSLLNTREAYYAKLATKYQPTSWFSLSGVNGWFGSGSNYSQASGDVAGLNWSWSQYNDDNVANQDGLALEHYLYGLGSYEQWTLGWNQHIWKGNAYLYYSDYKQELDITAYHPDEWVKPEYQDNRSLTIGYSWQGPWRSSIDTNVMKTLSESANEEPENEWTLSLNVSIPLSSSGEDYVNYNATYQDRDSSNSQYHRATYGHQFDTVQGANLGLEISGSGNSDDYASFSEQSTADITMSGGYQNEQWRGSAMVYADTDSEYNSYGDMQTTTVFSGGEMFQTREHAESYLLVKNSGDGTKSLEEGGDKFLTTAQLKKNNESSDRVVIDNAQVIHPLERYKEYQVMLDDSSSDYHNLGENFVQGSSYPGTVLNLNINNRELRSYISVFTNVEGQPINSVECHGEGCVSVEELTDGVFKFRVNKGLPFQLKTGQNQRCFIPSPSVAKRQNLGQNFCMPQFENMDGLQLAKGIDGQYYYYVGEFSDLDQFASYYENLNRSNPDSELVKKHIGDRSFLFIRSPQYLAQEEADLVRSLSEYALEEQSNSYYVYR